MDREIPVVEETYNLEVEQEDGSSDGEEPKRKPFNVFTHSYKSLKSETKSFATEIRQECFQLFEVYEVMDFVKNNWYKVVYVPYLPAFHQPGWLLRYITGPHTPELLANLLTDFLAGITVAMTLVPQALSYATLAGLPPVNGLYTATLASATYTFFGSSMQLAVGPVALVSLLMGELVVKYNIEPGSEESVNFAGEVAVAVGMILTLMSLLNLGNMIRFISHPVMSGFTTAAACLIGQNQLKGAFGFTIAVPQAGQKGYEWNYQVMRWFADNWNRDDSLTQFQLIRNYYAQRISLGLFFPMILFVIIKNNITPTPERKKTWWFNMFNLFVNMLPLVAILIGGHVAWQIKHDDHYNQPHYHHSFYAKKLSVVGEVTPGVDFLRVPNFKEDFGPLLADAFPMALILFMESWSVAQRIATQNSQLHLLNASQELWAMGVANFMCAFSSAYPVAGSFSRSSLNQAAGAKTPVSKVTTMISILLTLKYLTKTFQYIPNAALAAVIWCAIFNLVSISDFWHSWKHSKKDFLIMLVTAVVVYVTSTGVGLAVGMAISVLMLLVDLAFNPENAPQVVKFDEDHEKGHIIHLRFRADLNFLTAGRFSDLVTNYTLLTDDRTKVAADIENFNERVFFQVSSFLDSWLRPQLSVGVSHLPKAIIIDLTSVFVTDITAMQTLADMAKMCRSKGIAFAVINTSDSIARQLSKFHFENDSLTGRTHSLLADQYNQQAGDRIPWRKANQDKGVEAEAVKMDKDEGDKEDKLVGVSPLDQTV